MAFGSVLKNYNNLKKYPFGKLVFSYLFSINAPYFLNLRAIVEDLNSGYGNYCLRRFFFVVDY